MYIKPTTSYYKGTSQCARRQLFLIIVSSKDRKLGKDNFRGIVRKVAMEQLGHFMMGTARIGKETITLSGSYGSDGLTCSVSEEVFQRGIDIPEELYNAWNEGEGWNSAGNEAKAMREWALNNLEELRK